MLFFFSDADLVTVKLPGGVPKEIPDGPDAGKPVVFSATYEVDVDGKVLRDSEGIPIKKKKETRREPTADEAYKMAWIDRKRELATNYLETVKDCMLTRDEV